MSGAAPGTRHRSADVALGYAADKNGSGVAYVSIATGSGRTVAKMPFSFARPAELDDPTESERLLNRAMGYAAVSAAAGYLRGHGFTRIRVKIDDDNTIDDLNARTLVPPCLAYAYVKTRCVLHGFAAARIERAEPIDVHDLSTRARAEIGLRTPA